MPNPTLNAEQLQKAHSLLERIRKQLRTLAAGSEKLLFAYRRKLQKELMHDERGKPPTRNKLKRLKRAQQNGLFPICGEVLPDKDVVLDRGKAWKGYKPENTRLVHYHCDRVEQEKKGYK